MAGSSGWARTAVATPMLAAWWVAGVWSAIAHGPADDRGAQLLETGVMLALGGGLLWLMFQSRRHGYDDRASGRPGAPEGEERRSPTS